MKKRLLSETTMDLFDPPRRYLLLASRDDNYPLEEGDGAGDAAPEPSRAAADWRAAIADEAARAFAESSTDITHLAKRGVEMREKLSRAVFVPGKDSSAEEVASFNKALGVPETAEDYEWPAPLDGRELTDEVKAMRGEWAQFFLDNRFTRAQAENALARVAAINARHQEAALAADRAFAEEQEAMLKAEWPGDEFARNKEMANRAARQLFGGDFEAVIGLETRDGRLVMDNAIMARVFARIGREMSEGGLSVPMNETAAETIDAEIAALRGKQAEANANGDGKLANKFYQEEMALIQKRDGKQGLVGADGRAA